MVKDGILISTGYNGMPWGCSDDILPWDGTAKNEEENKRPYGNKATLTRGPRQVLEKYLKISVRGPGRGRAGFTIQGFCVKNNLDNLKKILFFLLK